MNACLVVVGDAENIYIIDGVAHHLAFGAVVIEQQLSLLDVFSPPRTSVRQRLHHLFGKLA